MQRTLRKFNTPKHEHDIFVSYSNQDLDAADTITKLLEQNGFSCWIAPHNVTYTSTWVDAVHEAIKRCRLFLLVFSRAVDRSDAVLNELILAKRQRKKQFVVRVRNHLPHRTILLIGALQWFDAFEQPLGAYAKPLAEAVRVAIENPPGRPPRFIISNAVHISLSSVSIVVAAFLMTLLLQLVFLVIRAPLLRVQDLSFWIVLFIFGLLTWTVRRVWLRFRRREEPLS